MAAIVKTQRDLGIDIVSDGEQSKASFQAYAAERLSGITPITPKPGERRTRENVAFPSFYRDGAHSGSAQAKWACTGPIKYVGHDALAADLDNLKRALGGGAPVDAFMPSVSPSSCAGLMENRHYASDEEHVLAVAEAMREEYEAIVKAGFQVQIDDPRLAMHYMLTPDESVEQARGWARRRVEVLNHALRNIPPERVRHHTCYGINHGAAHQRHGAQAPGRHPGEHQGRRLFLRDGEPAPRARVAGVGSGEAAGRQGADPGLRRRMHR